MRLKLHTAEYRRLPKGKRRIELIVAPLHEESILNIVAGLVATVTFPVAIVFALITWCISRHFSLNGTSVMTLMFSFASVFGLIYGVVLVAAPGSDIRAGWKYCSDIINLVPKQYPREHGAHMPPGELGRQIVRSGLSFSIFLIGVFGRQIEIEINSSTRVADVVAHLYGLSILSGIENWDASAIHFYVGSRSKLNLQPGDVLVEKGIGFHGNLYARAQAPDKSTPNRKTCK